MGSTQLVIVFYSGNHYFHGNIKTGKQLVELQNANLTAASGIGVRRGVSKGVENSRRLPALWAGHP
jgi:hypothetical protein